MTFRWVPRANLHVLNTQPHIFWVCTRKKADVVSRVAHDPDVIQLPSTGCIRASLWLTYIMILRVAPSTKRRTFQPPMAKLVCTKSYPLRHPHTDLLQLPIPFPVDRGEAREGREECLVQPHTTRLCKEFQKINASSPRFSHSRTHCLLALATFCVGLCCAVVRCSCTVARGHFRVVPLTTLSSRGSSTTQPKVPIPKAFQEPSDTMSPSRNAHSREGPAPAPKWESDGSSLPVQRWYLSLFFIFKPHAEFEMLGSRRVLPHHRAAPFHICLIHRCTRVARRNSPPLLRRGPDAEMLPFWPTAT